MRPKRRFWKHLFLTAGALSVVTVGTAGYLYLEYRSAPLIEILHLPEVYPRRSEHLSANVSGRALSRHVRRIRYRVNEGEWLEFRWIGTRARAPMFTLEMPPEQLAPGENVLTMETHARLRPPEVRSFPFQYDPSPIQLPLHRDWKNADLEVQDGYWESTLVDGVWRVRPVPGFEEYDRILLATGAFPGGRRIRTNVVFRSVQEGHDEFVVGVLSMWGGHPGELTGIPRTGWSFIMACFWSKPNGAGVEISHRYGEEDPSWVNSYRSVRFEPDVPYNILLEVLQEKDSEGNHLSYRERVKWWPEGERPPATWIEASDAEGSPLPEGEYAVAFLLYRCNAEFGPVQVDPIPPLIR